MGKLLLHKDENTAQKFMFPKKVHVYSRNLTKAYRWVLVDKFGLHM